jgi:hypothetical protein
MSRAIDIRCHHDADHGIGEMVRILNQVWTVHVVQMFYIKDQQNINRARQCTQTLPFKKSFKQSSA